MSNALAIATVTATLAQLVQRAVAADVPGATVTTVRPAATVQGSVPTTGVNVFLYQATPNTALRNGDLPTRRADGSVVQRPQAALDLHYLLSFYGDEAQLVPQRLLGSAVRTLHAQPVLTRADIADAVAGLAFLAGSTLADQVEAVKFAPLPLSLEDMAKLWSVFFQTPYSLSVAYQASVVLIEADDTPRPALPVLRRAVTAAPLQQPVIASVSAQDGPQAPITAASTLVIRGSGLGGDGVSVRFGPVVATPDAADVRDDQIILPVPAGLPAGLQGVQVVHSIMVGTPPAARPGPASPVAPFVLCPVITQSGGAYAITVANATTDAAGLRSADVTIDIAPPLQSGQQAALLLDEANPAAGQPAHRYQFAAPPVNAASGTVTLPISAVQPGDYLVRMQVDGAQSPLDVDTAPNSPTFNRFVAPMVTI